MSGIERIAKERQRQLDVEGWNAEHDRGHAEELAMAAATYALTPEVRNAPLGRLNALHNALWPWAPRYYKPTRNDRVRELEKAGALIAAAIDDLVSETSES